MTAFALPGQKVTRCDSGKVVAIVKAPLVKNGIGLVADFEWLIEPPMPGDLIGCEGPDLFVRHVGSQKALICIDGEWLPKLKESPEGS